MSDSTISANNVRTLLADKGFLTSQGDLIAVAEALFIATADQINGITRKSINAARDRLGALSLLNDITNKLDGAHPLDAGTVALGADQASCDALVANLQTFGVSLPTGSSYYIESLTIKNGAITESQGSHIASQSERTKAESGVLEAPPDANGNEVRMATNSDGSFTIYTLHKNDTVSTAAATDVAQALDDIEPKTALLMESFATDMLQVKAFLEEKHPLEGARLFGNLRSEEGKALDKRQVEYLALAEVATRRAQEQREQGNEPSRPRN